jgi:hypothetical protein
VPETPPVHIVTVLASASSEDERYRATLEEINNGQSFRVTVAAPHGHIKRNGFVHRANALGWFQTCKIDYQLS